MNNILIYSARVARDLLKKEYKLVDIIPDEKLNIKTLFYFENTEDIKKYLKNEHNILIK